MTVKKTGYDVGVYESTVKDQFVNFVYPQETGNKTDVRFMALADKDGNGLLVDATDHLLEMSALHYTQEDLDKAGHPYQLEENKKYGCYNRLRTNGTWNGKLCLGNSFEIPCASKFADIFIHISFESTFRRNERADDRGK